MRQEKISIASMSAILGGHYLDKRGRLDALLFGWEYFRLLMITRTLPCHGDSHQVECLVEQIIGADIRELLADHDGFARLSRAELETGLLFYNDKDCPPLARMTLANEILFVCLALILAYVIVFSIPAG